MSWLRHLGRTATRDTASISPGRNRIRALIDQATSDSVDESDEHAGLLSTIREEVVCPFAARLGGDNVECIGFEWPRNGYGLNAVCKCKGKTQVVDISKLEIAEPRPRGYEWIEAYFAWLDMLH
jgi:hypothetical protein